MTREEKAHSLGQNYFPDANNVWERPNYEAQWVAMACIRMAEWEHKRLVEKACEWIESIDFDMRYWNPEDGVLVGDFLADFCKAMEE